MLKIKTRWGKKIIMSLLYFDIFNKNFAVLKWGDWYFLRRTKPIEELVKIKITEDNILKLKFSYHSSNKVMKEYIAEISKHDFENGTLLLNFWTSEDRITLSKSGLWELSEETNQMLKNLLGQKVFKEKYGDDYHYFLSLNLDRKIIKAKKEERQFAQLTLKYSLQTANNKKEMRLKSKFSISKSEATKFCSMVSYWKE